MRNSGMSRRTSLASFGWWFRRRDWLCGLGFFRGRQVEVAAARVAELDVGGLHQGVDGANWKTHLASSADLVANDGHALFASSAKPIIVPQEGLGDLGSEV